MKLVRAIKTYGHIRVATAMEELGWYFKYPKRRSTNIEKMVESMPRIELERVLNILRRDWPTYVPNVTPTSQDFVESMLVLAVTKVSAEIWRNME